MVLGAADFDLPVSPLPTVGFGAVRPAAFVGTGPADAGSDAVDVDVDVGVGVDVDVDVDVAGPASASAARRRLTSRGPSETPSRRREGTT